ncbi:ACT domain-containing protein [Streptosporangium soli]|nr:ACT domain-containing protein [Streptosporangium sp. KLBMP 9127]
MSDTHDEGSAHTSGQAPSTWRREAAELAALFTAVGLAHLLATLLGHTDPGPFLLIALGVALVTGAFIHKRLHSRRRTGRLPETVALVEDRPMTLWRIRTRVVDRPGRLAALAGAFAHHRCNVLALHIAATGGSAISPPGCDALDEFIVESPAELTGQDLRKLVGRAGGLDVVVVRAYVKDLIDPGVQALDLAHRVGLDPDRLPEAMSELLRATEVQWRHPGATVHDTGDHSTTLVVSVHPERALLIKRPALPFTPAEAARAAALAAAVKQRRYSS